MTLSEATISSSFDFNDVAVATALTFHCGFSPPTLPPMSFLFFPPTCCLLGYGCSELLRAGALCVYTVLGSVTCAVELILKDSSLAVRKLRFPYFPWSKRGTTRRNDFCVVMQLSSSRGELLRQRQIDRFLYIHSFPLPAPVMLQFTDFLVVEESNLPNGYFCFLFGVKALLILSPPKYKLRVNSRLNCSF